MSYCIVTEGEKWDTCSNHRNGEGEHGMYMCVYLYKKNPAYNAPQYCKLLDFELPDELFHLEK